MWTLRYTVTGRNRDEIYRAVAAKATAFGVPTAEDDGGYLQGRFEINVYEQVTSVQGDTVYWEAQVKWTDGKHLPNLDLVEKVGTF